MAPETKRYGATMLSENLISDTETAAAFLTLMGNEKRLAIMSHLVDDELTVGTIAEKSISANRPFRSIWRSCAPLARCRPAAIGR